MAGMMLASLLLLRLRVAKFGQPESHPGERNSMLLCEIDNEYREFSPFRAVSDRMEM